MRPSTRDLSDAHEIFLADLLGGRRTPGSGNQPANPMDGRNRRYDTEHCLCWDGKATLGKSIGVTRAMWGKAVEQSHGETPLLALRFYDNERLKVGLDLITLSAHDFAEIVHDARQWREAQRGQ